MEEDIRAAKDYATVLAGRLARMETIERNELQGLSRIALWLLNAVRGTNSAASRAERL